MLAFKRGATKNLKDDDDVEPFNILTKSARDKVDGPLQGKSEKNIAFHEVTCGLV